MDDKPVILEVVQRSSDGPFTKFRELADPSDGRPTHSGVSVPTVSEGEENELAGRAADFALASPIECLDAHEATPLACRRDITWRLLRPFRHSSEQYMATT